MDKASSHNLNALENASSLMQRFLDDVHLESGNPLSDHYGVMLTLEVIP